MLGNRKEYIKTLSLDLPRRRQSFFFFGLQNPCISTSSQINPATKVANLRSSEKSSAKMMRYSSIDVGQSSKKSATKVEGKLSKKKSCKKIKAGNLSEDFGTKVALSQPSKKEEAADFKESVMAEFTSQYRGVWSYPSTFVAEISGYDGFDADSEAHKALLECFYRIGRIQRTRSGGGYVHIGFDSLDSLYKALDITKIGDQPVTVKMAFPYPNRAEVRGFDTSAGAEEAHKALEKHFKDCGSIEGIRVNLTPGYAYIDFASIDSLHNALELNNTRVDGHPVTVVQPGGGGCSRHRFGGGSVHRFRADVSWSHDIDLMALTPHFEKCGTIRRIDYGSRCASVLFTHLDSLNEALKLDKTRVDNQKIRVRKCIVGGGL